MRIPPFVHVIPHAAVSGLGERLCFVPRTHHIRLGVSTGYGYIRLSLDAIAADIATTSLPAQSQGCDTSP